MCLDIKLGIFVQMMQNICWETLALPKEIFHIITSSAMKYEFSNIYNKKKRKRELLLLGETEKAVSISI